MDTPPSKSESKLNSTKHLSESYNGIIHKLNALFKEAAALSNDSEICHGIHVAWLKLSVWASDIDLQKTNILETIWKEAPILAEELGSRMHAVEHALTKLETELNAKDASTSGQLNPVISDLIDAGALLVQLADPVLHFKAGEYTATWIDQVIEKRSDRLTALSEFEHLLSTEDAKDLGELQSCLKLQRAVPIISEKSAFQSTASKSREGTIISIESSPIRRKVPASALEAQYTFSPIDRRETRLATILPGKLGEDIVCSLQVFQVCQLALLEYEAVSYAWNFHESKFETVWVTEEKIHEIHNNFPVLTKRQKLVLRSHVFECLQQLRRADKPFTIWIDILCLDLRSAQEKLSQSVNFADIFAHARCVNIWLGRDDETLAKVSAWVNRLIRLDSPHDLELTSKADWEPFLRFLNHDLFCRRWIVQEIILARQGRFLSSNAELEWQSFSDAISIWTAAKSSKPQLALMLYQSIILNPSRHLTSAYRSYAETINDVRNTCARRDESGTIVSLAWTLEDLVISFSGMTNSELRDSVFAYLFLAMDTPYTLGKSTLSSRWKSAQSTISSRQLNQGESWYLNYSCPVEIIFEQFIKHCIRSSGSLDIICRPWAPESNLLLPSWMKKRQGHNTCHRSPLVSFVSDPMRRGQIYRAAGHTAPVYKFRHGSDAASEFVPSEILQLVQNRPFKWRTEVWRKLVEHITHSTIVPNSLSVNGLLLGKITQITPRLTRGLIPRESLELGGIYFSDEPHKWTSNDIPKELWQTLVANRSLQNDQPSLLYPLTIARWLNGSPDGDLDTRSPNQEETAATVISEVLTRIREVTWNRRLFRAGKDEELLGLAPADAESGDMVCILFGCSVPVILRERFVGSTSYFELIGDSFVHGKMEGEAIEDLDKTELEKRTMQIDVR